jgi:hypothetical protein
LRGPGCRAQPTSRQAIVEAFADVKADLDVRFDADWLSRCYQPANRLATLWFARVRGETPLPFWLVSIYFVGEIYRDTVLPTAGPQNVDEWRQLIDELHAELGLPDPHLLAEWAPEVFLPALRRPEDDAVPRWARVPR